MVKQTRHRATKSERLEVEKALKCIIEKAYTEGSARLLYEPEAASECMKVFYALGEYRKKVKKSPLQDYEFYLKLCAVMFRKISDNELLLERKPQELTKTTDAVLNIANRFPELLQNSPKPVDTFSKVLAGFDSKH